MQNLLTKIMYVLIYLLFLAFRANLFFIVVTPFGRTYFVKTYSDGISALYDKNVKYTLCVVGNFSLRVVGSGNTV